jgi:hypothetical protein
MLMEELKQNVTVYGPLFPEPVQVIIAIPMGASVKLIGKGIRSSTVYEPILKARHDRLFRRLDRRPAENRMRGSFMK